MKRIELFLIDHDEIRLDEFRFHPDGTSKPLVTLCGGSPIYCMSGSRNTFAWSAGVRALTILLLKMALNRPGDLSLIGHIGSPAATLDYALSKEPKWLEDFFGVTAQGHSQAKNLFGRRNSERKRPGPVEVFGSERHLPSEAIQVYLNGEPQSSATLPALISALESEFGSGKGRGRSMKRELERKNQQRSMHRLELHLSNNGELRLDEFRFFDPETAETLITTNASSSTTSSGEKKNLFNWTNGVKALTLLLLRAASSGAPGASLVGESGSLAASLDYALSREPAWLIDFFGMTSNGRAAARRYLGRRNAERRRPGPVEVYINEKLLPRQNLVVYVNGEIPSVDTIRRLAVEVEAEFSGKAGEGTSNVPPANSTICPRDERETSPFVIGKRTVREFLDPEAKQLTYALTSDYLNVSNEDVGFLQLHAYVSSGREVRDLTIACPEDPNLHWHVVTERPGYQRMLVEFSQPLAPGAAKTVSMSYRIDEVAETEARLELSLRVPCSELNFEVSCSKRYQVSNYAIHAEREDDILFGTLPLPTLGKDDNGNSAVRWTMKYPPHGYHYRLFWALEERPSKRLSERMLANAIRSTPDADCSRKTKAKRVRQTVM